MDITAGRLQYMLERLSDSLTVTAYGAIGNGAADDAPAIQAALNAARDKGGGWIVVPPGTYLLATLPLRIYKNTRLTLLPGAVFVRGADQTMLLNGDAAQNFGGYTGNGNIIIEGGLWRMEALTPGLTASRMCISIGHARNITIRDIEVRDTPGYHGIELNSTKDAQIVNCSFRGYVDPGGRSVSEAIQFDLAKDSGAFGGFGPYDQTPCEDIVVRDCYVGASDTVGTVPWPRGIGSHSATINRWHRRIHIVDNMFENCAAHAIRAYSWEDAVITGNTITGCGSGIAVRTVDISRTADTLDTTGVQTNASQNAWGVVIANNTIREGGTLNEPIIVEGETTGRNILVSITGNIIRTTGTQNGIRVVWAYRVTITGNVLHAVAATGISLANVQGVAITGNRVHDCGTSGITSDSSAEVLISSNNITTCGVNGVHVLGGSQIKIADNFVRNAGKTDGTGFGYRVSTNTDRITITGNTYSKQGSGFEAINALGITNTVTKVRRYGNDWIGQGRVADVDDTSTAPNLSPLDSGA